MSHYLIADIGSTTTKAFLFSNDGDLLASARTATTVEKPFEDVKIGLRNAIKDIEQGTGKIIFNNQGEISSEINVLLTSSAGGGLEMLVVGITDLYSAKIGRKAALGAGAIIQEVICGGDGRDIDDKIRLLGKIFPDIILLVGGINSNNITNICMYAEYIKKSKMRNKYKKNPIPILYAGNECARSEIVKILEDYPVFIDRNICQDFMLPDTKDLQKKIIEIFFEHVMEDAPGYAPLKNIVEVPILPTPIAVTKTLHLLSEDHNNILMFDIGGATTDVFTLYNDKMFRSVSANIGMSFSIENVLNTSGLKNIIKYLRFHIDEDEILNYIGNKKLNPTSIPQSKIALEIERSVAINAITIALNNHFALYKEDLEQKSQKFTRIKIYQKTFSLKTFLDSFDVVIGSGGIVSNNVDLNISKEIIENAVERKDIPRIYIDKGFMFPHVGVLSDYKPEMAKKILYKYSLSNLNDINPPAEKIKTYVRKLNKNKEIKPIQNPEITINNYLRITVKKKSGDGVVQGEILGERRAIYSRVYAMPIPLGENQVFKWRNPNRAFKKGDKLATVSIAEKIIDTIIAPLDGEIIEFKKYVIIFKEKIDIKEVKVSLNRKEESTQYIDELIEHFYPKGIVGKIFKQNQPIIYDKLNTYFISAPISGKVVSYDKSKQELILKRFENIERLTSFASGRITKIGSDRIKIKTIGKQIVGLQGYGESIKGRLGKEIIIVRNKNNLNNLYEPGVYGGIAYCIPYKDYIEFIKNIESKKQNRSLILLQGFGGYEESSFLENFLDRNANKNIYLSPFTRIKAGVERPFAYVE